MKYTIANPSASTQTGHPLEELIRERAYELYELRGREDGKDVDDWLQAEAELTRKRSAAA